MNDDFLRWSIRYSKALRDYPELKEASNLSMIKACAVSSRYEQKLQQIITAALICDNPYTYDGRNIMDYNLETCNTPTDRNYYPDSLVSYELMFLFKSRCHTPLYRIAVERLERIYFTL